MRQQVQEQQYQNLCQSMHSFKLLPRRSTAAYPSFEDYYHQPVGKGAFGTVYLSTHKISHKVFAIKAISKLDSTGTPKQTFYLDQVNHQLEIMYQLDCQYIIRVIDHFQDAKNIFLVLEYADGVELYKGIIQKKKRLVNQQIAKVIYQLCLALKHLHERGIIHRDIKPENIILTKSKDIKLIDFGTSNYIGPQEIRMTRTGSIPYFAPEIVTRTKHGEAVDVWCVGILLYEMFFLKTPFEEMDKTQMNIISNKVVYPSGIEPDMKDLIGRILIKDPTKRLGINEIMNHPWIVKYVVGNVPAMTFRSQSKSLEKQSLSSRRMSPKQMTKKSVEKSKSKEKEKSVSKSKSVKSLSKYPQPKSPNDILKDKILKLQKQIVEATHAQKKQEEKQKSLLLKKANDIQSKLVKYSKESTKYQSIFKINSKKITQINQEINEFYTFKQENQHVQSQIALKKQEESALIEQRKALRLQLANLETKLENVFQSGMNKKSSLKLYTKQNLSRSKSQTKSIGKPILSNRSINNVHTINSSLEKYLSTKSEKMTTEGSARETNIAEIEGYLNNLMTKHNLNTH